MFKRHRYPRAIILQAVYFKLRFTLSYRDVEECRYPKNWGIYNPKSFTRARKRLQRILTSASPSELVQELDAKVEEAITLYR